MWKSLDLMPKEVGRSWRSEEHKPKPGKKKTPGRERGTHNGGMAWRWWWTWPDWPKGAGTWLHGQFRQEITSPGSLVTDSEGAEWSPCQHPGLSIETEHHNSGIRVRSCRRGDIWKIFYFWPKMAALENNLGNTWLSVLDNFPIVTPLVYFILAVLCWQ